MDWHFSRLVCIFPTLSKSIRQWLVHSLQRIKHNSVTLSMILSSKSVDSALDHDRTFLSGRSSSLSSTVTLVGTGPSAAVAAPEDQKPHRRQSQGQVGLRGSWLTCSRSWKWVRQAGGRRFQRCECAGSSWHHGRTVNCCHSLAGHPAASAAGSPPPASPCRRGAP